MDDAQALWGARVSGCVRELDAASTAYGRRAGRVPQRRVIAIGGGKGGIGKSLIAASLGVHLSQLGQRVVLMDADLGGANLHTCLGMKPPKRTLSDFVERRCDTLGELVSPTGMPRLGLISGAQDVLAAANPKYAQKQRLLREVTRLDVDVVIIDLGGGTGFNILDFFLVADDGVLTVVPEPTSIENAYRFIKAACYRRIKLLDVSWHLRPLVEQAINQVGGRGVQTPAELVRYVRQRDPRAANLLYTEMASSALHLVVNQTRSAQEDRLGHAISAACQRYFGVPLHFLAAIPYDDEVWKAVRRRRPLILENPQARASLAIRRLAGALGFQE